MITKIYRPDGSNTGKLKETNKEIKIHRGRWIEGKDNTSHPMSFKKIHCFENKNVYGLHLFGDDTKRVEHIVLNYWKEQKFLWLQNAHWLQKEENIRYIINMLILSGTLVIGLLNFFK
jgi:hypothetical protein